MKPAAVLPALLCLALAGCPSADGGKTQSGGSAPPSDSPSASPSVQPSPPPSPEQSKGPNPLDVGPAPPPYPRPEDGVTGTQLLRSMPLQVGPAKLEVWIADTAASRTLGLMHVTHMDEGRGMIFVYPEAGRRAFWMRNTKIPLSLAYIAADGTVDQLLDMEPMTTTSHPSKGSIRLVLEVNQGWFARHGVKVGDHVPGVTGLVGY
ncbi:MAG: DUF192 domain-containing protein [Planctomycetota bacterium]